MFRTATIFASLALLLTLFACLCAAQNVTITLTPQGIPIQIPSSGGSFNYIIAATNNGTAPQQATVWCMLTLPSGSPYGPVLGPVTITLNPGQTMDRLRTQVVPAGAPTGNYVFNAYIGAYPNIVWDSDSFPFEKTTGGSELWVARYNGPGNGSDGASSLAVDGAGNVYVTGSSSGSGTGSDYATIKYDAAGVQQWVARYNGPGNGIDPASSLVVDGGGNVYVTGFSEGSGTYRDYATIKYDAEGVQQWVARYNGPGNYSDEAKSLAVDGSGNVYVTGQSDGSGTGPDHATIKYDAAGVEQWVARYNGPGNSWDYASSLAVDDSGNVYVTGRSNGIVPGGDYVTIKYDSAGVEQWLAIYNGPGNGTDEAYNLAVDAGGNVYVTGRSVGSGTGYDYATIKYDAAGVQQWAARYNGQGANWDDAHSLAVDGDGNVYVTGGSNGSGTETDYATIKYDATGVEQWAARYNGPGNFIDRAQSLAVDGGGNVYVTGYSTGSGTFSDYATIKYNAAGQQQWVARYNGLANGQDLAGSLAVDGGGNVFVTGGSPGSGTSSDYATIKYSGGSLDSWMPVEATVLGAQPCAPTKCRLEGNYPNPFNALTALSYQLSANSHVSLKVYDSAGRIVTTLVDGWRAAGEHELTWDAADLPSGMYFARLTAGDYVGVQKLILLK